MRLIFSVLALIITLPLFGCMDEVYEGVRIAKEITFKQYIKDRASSGDVEYQYKAGKLFCCGDRPEFDNVEALKWFCEAAKNGQRDAMFEVGKMYETANTYKGEIIPQDLVLSYVYYQLADQHGNQEAAEYGNKIAEKLTPEQIGKSEVLSERWPAIHCEHTRG